MKMPDPWGQAEQFLLYYQGGGGGRTRTYEGVSQRIYSPPPLPLGTLPRRRTSHPRGRAFPLAGRGYGEPPARCHPRESGPRRSVHATAATPVLAPEAARPGTVPRKHPTG